MAGWRRRSLNHPHWAGTLPDDIHPLGCAVAAMVMAAARVIAVAMLMAVAMVVAVAMVIAVAMVMTVVAVVAVAIPPHLLAVLVVAFEPLCIAVHGAEQHHGCDQAENHLFHNRCLFLLRFLWLSIRRVPAVRLPTSANGASSGHVAKIVENPFAAFGKSLNHQRISPKVEEGIPLMLRSLDGLSPLFVVYRRGAGTNQKVEIREKCSFWDSGYYPWIHSKFL